MVTGVCGGTRGKNMSGVPANVRLGRYRPRSEPWAEGEGFEPPRPCGPPVFKTGAFNHSAIPPECGILYQKNVHSAENYSRMRKSSIELANLETGSTSIIAPSSVHGPSATSNRDGIPVTNRFVTAFKSRPMDET